MPQHRYQRDTRIRPDQEALPLQSICAILTRQSTLVQAERNVFSAEVNPQDLVDVALRLGFAQDHVRVVDADMGIGAYDTVISDRPGLQKWLYEDLPSGESLVVLVSQEDRLFRDKWEDQHNAFIRQVAIHGGWVICGQNIYNFRRDWDRDRFRMACKYGRMYIEHHVLQRLHPAAQRAAMQGRYVGGVVSWGYVVDYDRRSETYKRLVPYPPHVALVQEELFRFFASMPQASVSGVVRHWEESGLLFPFYGDDVDPHVVRSASRRKRDDIRGGYVIEYRQVQRALTDVTYLGWRVRQGEVAWDGIKDAPLSVISRSSIQISSGIASIGLSRNVLPGHRDAVGPSSPSLDRAESSIPDRKASAFLLRGVYVVRFTIDRMPLDGYIRWTARPTCFATVARLSRHAVIAIAPTWRLSRSSRLCAAYLPSY